jgi:CheY-like chemotaxis protein
MPVLDGRGFRAEQQRDRVLAKIPVLLVTADPHAGKTANELGASGYLQKPVDVGDLLRTLHAMVAEAPQHQA